jgi:hypothetical protein
VHPGCTTKAHVRGLCKLHTTQELCFYEDCTKNAVRNLVCIKHGAYGICSATPECGNVAVNLKSQYKQHRT